MVGATQTVLLVASIEQTRMPVRTELPDQTDPTTRVSKGDQLLAVYLDLYRLAVRLW
jgi:hypothetical protein